MIKKIASIFLALIVVLSMAFNVSAGIMDNVIAMDISDMNLIMPDVKIRSTATIADNFREDSILVVLTKEASRNNRDITVGDFIDIGAATVEDLVRLSDVEYHYVESVWSAQLHKDNMVRRDMASLSVADGHISFDTLEAIRQYERVREIAEGNTLVNVDEFRRILFVTLEEPGKENVLRAIRILEQREDIRHASPNYIQENLFDRVTSTSVNPNDPRRTEQWAIDRIELPGAWGYSTGSANVLVGVIDSGIDGTHEDLVQRVNANLSRDFVGSSNGLVDPDGHGTHVAGIIGAQGNNGIGIAGTNWNVQLVSLRVLNDWGGWGPLGPGAVAKAVDHARVNNIPILNASLRIGYNDSYNQVIREAIASFNGLHVNSAGNYRSNTNSVARFEGFPNVLVVGSTDQNDNRSNFSNWGSTSTHLFAPGSYILSTLPNNRYGLASGTSMAAPYVAGVVALRAAKYPALSMAQHRAAILETVDVLPQLSGLAITGGRLNAYAVMKEGGSSDLPVFIMATAGDGGTVTGYGIYFVGDTVVLTATPYYGFVFVGWFEDNIRINGSTPTYSFIANEFRMLEARFLRQSGFTLPVFIMAVAGEGGKVEGAGLYSYGDIVYLEAIPDFGRNFVGWYENNERIHGAGLLYSFVAEDFRMIEASFD